MDNKVDLSKYNHTFSISNKLGRMVWNLTYWFFFRPFDLNPFKSYRSFILKIFGAKVGKGANIYASVKVWAPWNLEIGEYSTLGPHVDCYNQGKIKIGANTTISQKSYLCASSHDISDPLINLILCPIEIGSQVWIAADTFIGPNVAVGDGAVVGARAAVFKYVDPWTVVGGNPAKFIKNRELRYA